MDAVRRSSAESEFPSLYAPRPGCSFLDLCKIAHLEDSAKGLEESARNLQNSTGGVCIAASADVRDPVQLQRAVSETKDKFGKIDFVICGEVSIFLTPYRTLMSR